MTNDSDRGPVRWGRVGLGLLVGGPAMYAIAAQIVHVAIRWDGTPPSELGLSVLLGVLLGCFVIVGGLLVVHGARGTKRLLPIVRTLGLVVLLASGLCIAALQSVLMANVGVLPETSQDVAEVTLAISAVALLLLALFVWKCARGHSPSQRWWRAHDLCVVVLPFALAIFFLIVVSSPRLQHRPRPRPPACVNNARNMAIIFSERSIKRGWPPYGGRNFVLSLVAYKLIDIRNPDNLEIFFCPEPGAAIRPPGRAAYEDVTKEALTRRRFPGLTDFAGRRNDEPSYRLQTGEDAEVEPLLACVLGDLVVVGFSDGAVRRMDREDLGLGPDDPIVFGEASASPILRKLSDR